MSTLTVPQLEDALGRERDRFTKMRLSRNLYRQQFIKTAIRLIPEDKHSLIPKDYAEDALAEWLMTNLETLTGSAF